MGFKEKKAEKRFLEACDGAAFAVERGGPVSTVIELAQYYAEGNVDGVHVSGLSRDTSTAIRLYQMARELPNSGIYDRTISNALRELGAE